MNCVTIFLDQSGGWHTWQDEAGYNEHLEKYAHPMWTSLREQISSNEQGHGGMDCSIPGLYQEKLPKFQAPCGGCDRG